MVHSKVSYHCGLGNNATESMLVVHMKIDPGANSFFFFFFCCWCNFGKSTSFRGKKLKLLPQSSR